MIPLRVVEMVPVLVVEIVPVRVVEMVPVRVVEMVPDLAKAVVATNAVKIAAYTIDLKCFMSSPGVITSGMGSVQRIVLAQLILGPTD